MCREGIEAAGAWKELTLHSVFLGPRAAVRDTVGLSLSSFSSSHADAVTSAKRHLYPNAYDRDDYKGPVPSSAGASSVLCRPQTIGRRSQSTIAEVLGGLCTTIRSY